MLDMRSDTATWPHTFLPLSVLKRVTELLLVNVDRSARLYVEELADEIVANTSKVRFNVLRVLPRPGKAVKSFSKF